MAHDATAGTRIFVGLGSNLGPRERHLHDAATYLAAQHGFRLLRLSRIYETKPVGPVAQGTFLNAVAEVLVVHSPRRVLDALLAYEASAGRVRKAKWGPRVIDLDILLFGAARIDEPGLRIPHPELANRAFVLVPLAELEPDLVVPGLAVTVSALRDRRPDLGDVVPAGDFML